MFTAHDNQILRCPTCLRYKLVQKSFLLSLSSSQKHQSMCQNNWLSSFLKCACIKLMTKSLKRRSDKHCPLTASEHPFSTTPSTVCWRASLPVHRRYPTKTRQNEKIGQIALLRIGLITESLRLAWQHASRHMRAFQNAAPLPG